MDSSSSLAAIDRWSRPASGRWATLAAHRRIVFMTAGTLVLGSLAVPIGFSPVTPYGWVAGLLLVGLGVASAAIGLLGLYPTIERQAPVLAVASAATAVVAGLAGTALVALSAIAIAWIWAVGGVPSIPKPLFLGTASLLAIGYGLGCTLAGLGTRSAGPTSAATARFLLLGGAVLLATAIGALLRTGLGIGPPPWTVFPVILLAGLATVGAGVSGGADVGQAGGSDE